MKINYWTQLYTRQKTSTIIMYYITHASKTLTQHLHDLNEVTLCTMTYFLSSCSSLSICFLQVLSWPSRKFTCCSLTWRSWLSLSLLFSRLSHDSTNDWFSLLRAAASLFSESNWCKQRKADWGSKMLKWYYIDDKQRFRGDYLVGVCNFIDKSLNKESHTRLRNQCW